MSYRGRLAQLVRDSLRTTQRQFNVATDDSTLMRALTDGDVIEVEDVHVSPESTDQYLRIDTRIVGELGNGFAHVTLYVDKFTALNLLFQSPLDETRVIESTRAPIRDTTERHNRGVYDALRRSAEDQR